MNKSEKLSDHDKLHEIIELNTITKFCENLGINQSLMKKTEGPDFLYENKIGIEVTSLEDGQLISREKAIWDLLDEYKRTYINSLCDKGWFISVDFIEYSIPDKGLSKLKNQIFHELEDLRKGKKEIYQCQFCCHFEITKKECDCNDIWCPIVYESEESINEYLRKIIKKKEQKLIEYKKKDWTKDISSYWLIINIPPNAPYCLRSQDHLLPISSSYERVFVIFDNKVNEYHYI